MPDNGNRSSGGSGFSHDQHHDHTNEPAEYHLPESGVDYAAVPQAELIRAVMRGRPGNLRAVGDGWQRLGSTLNERSAELDDRAKALAQRWTGTAFDQYLAMVNDVTVSARQVAATALDLRDIAYADADLLDGAQRALVGAGAVGGTQAGGVPGGGLQVSGGWGTAIVRGAGDGATVNVMVTPPIGA